MTATLSIQHTCRVESYVAAAATYMPAGLVLLSQTPTVQTCLLVECCCKMDACWTVATHLACLLTFCMRGSRIFFRGGSRPDGQKTVWTTFCFCCFSRQLILQFTEGVPWSYYRENHTFSRIQRGSNISQGCPTFSRGSNC